MASISMLSYVCTFACGALVLLTPWCRVLLEKLTGLQLVKKFPAFHGTRRFITALTSARHLSLSWARQTQSIYPHPTSWKSDPALYRLLTFQVPIFIPLCLLRDASPGNTPPRRFVCGSSLPLDCFVSRASIPPVNVSQHKCFTGKGC